MSIFTITAIVAIDPYDTEGKKTFGNSKPTRVFGYYGTLKQAIEAVKDNRGGMDECLYQWIVIEEIPEGIHASTIEEYWFEWIAQRWQPIEQKPERFRSIVNFGIG